MRNTRMIAWLAASLAPVPAAAAPPAVDTQVWSEFDVMLAPAPNLAITALGVMRQGDSVPNPALWGGGVIVDRRFGALTLSLGDLAGIARSSASGARLRVDVPLAAFTLTHRAGRLTLSDRNRFEQLRGIPGDPWRWRNRIEIDRTLDNAGPIKALFVSEEGFYDLAAHRWTRSRAQAGVDLRAGAHATFKVYYLRQGDRDQQPGAINAIGLTLALRL